MGVMLDDPGRYDEIRRILSRKRFLRRLYRESYQKFAECLSRCPGEGIALELGSGAGFVKEVVPEMTTSDVIAYPGVDRILNAADMPFGDERLGGRILMVDQHLGWISTWILKYGGHEPFSPGSAEWSFDSSGPLSGANGALAWIVFRRDVEKFGKLCPFLRLERYEPHTPLRYWISGGLKVWSLTPGWSFGTMTWVDRVLTRIHPDLGS